MCLLAGHAGRGFSVVLINTGGSGSVRDGQASLRAHSLTERPRRSRPNTAPSQAASSYFTARCRPIQRFAQQLTRTAVCSSLAVKCASPSEPGKVPTVQALDNDANVVFESPLTRLLTALPILGATLLILTAQPSSAEASLQVNRTCAFCMLVFKRYSRLNEICFVTAEYSTLKRL